MADATLRTRLAATLVSTAALLCIAAASPASAADRPQLGSVESPIDAGSVVVVDERGSALSAGGSADLFTLRLPRGAACPGDSAFDQWRVQTFLVPVVDDPATLRYAVIGPDGANRYSLRNPNTSPYIHQLTRSNSAPGAPGAIDPLPYFSLDVFEPGALPAGRYRMGVACTYFRETASYWDVEIAISADATDSAAGFRWTVVDAPAGAIVAGSTRSGTDAALLGIAVLAVLIVVFRVSRRSRAARRTATRPTADTTPNPTHHHAATQEQS